MAALAFLAPPQVAAWGIGWKALLFLGVLITATLSCLSVAFVTRWLRYARRIIGLYSTLRRECEANIIQIRQLQVELGGTREQIERLSSGKQQAESTTARYSDHISQLLGENPRRRLEVSGCYLSQGTVYVRVLAKPGFAPKVDEEFDLYDESRYHDGAFLGHFRVMKKEETGVFLAIEEGPVMPIFRGMLESRPENRIETPHLFAVMRPRGTDD